VRDRRFGTLPTITLNLQKLVELGLIKQVVGDDKRVKWLKPTPAADKFFEQRGKLLTEAGFKVG
jgi:DNA-binding MarR family transcriptional regulator